MREKFEAPKNWLNRFKHLAQYSGDAQLECFRTSKWVIEVNLVDGPLCLIRKFKINARTGKMV